MTITDLFILKINNSSQPTYFKRLRHFAIAIITYLISLSGFSQSGIILQGKIITGEEDASLIHVINFSQNTGTTTGSNGTFEIRVNENDTLLFTAVQYERLEIQISPEVYKNKFLTVVLKEAINEMDELNLSNTGLTGRINTDLDQIKTFNKYNLGIPLSTKPLPSQHDRRISSASSTPVDLLLNVLSGRLKKLKEEREVFQLISLVGKAEEALPEDFFTNYLELSENDIVNFLYFCAEKSDLRVELSTGNKIALMEYFQEMKDRYEEFLTEN